MFTHLSFFSFFFFCSDLAKDTLLALTSNIVLCQLRKRWNNDPKTGHTTKLEEEWKKSKREIYFSVVFLNDHFFTHQGCFNRISCHLTLPFFEKKKSSLFFFSFFISAFSVQCHWLVSLLLDIFTKFVHFQFFSNQKNPENLGSRICQLGDFFRFEKCSVKDSFVCSW
jgi:hypothetical protein